jgi:stage III sporulation protein AB
MKERDMIVNVLAAAIIVTFSGVLGSRLANRYSLRVKEIRLFQGAISELESEIIYFRSFLPDVFEKLAHNSLGGLARFFYAVGEKLSAKSGYSVAEAWEASLLESKPFLNLDREEYEIISQFGRHLGIGDNEGHRRCFDMMQQKLRNQERKADEARVRYEKMYRSLGLLGGLALALILL